MQFFYCTLEYALSILILMPQHWHLKSNIDLAPSTTKHLYKMPPKELLRIESAVSKYNPLNKRIPFRLCLL